MNIATSLQVIVLTCWCGKSAGFSVPDMNLNCYIRDGDLYIGYLKQVTCFILYKATQFLQKSVVNENFCMHQFMINSQTMWLVTVFLFSVFKKNKSFSFNTLQLQLQNLFLLGNF